MVQVDHVADELAIQALLNRYARAVDTKDWQLYRSVFTADALIDYSSAGAWRERSTRSSTGSPPISA